MTTSDELALNVHTGDQDALPNLKHVALVCPPEGDEGVHGPAQRARELCDRGVPGFMIEPIDGSELMSRRALGVPAITIFAGTSPDQVALYRLSNVVLSPSTEADRQLMAMGVRARRVCRWQFAVDVARYSPAHYSSSGLPGAGDPDTINLLYAGVTDEGPDVEQMLEAFAAAKRYDGRLQLVTSERSAAAYASAELLLVPGRSDLYGQAIVNAQASGLPVLAVDEGAAAELICSGRSGCLVPSPGLPFAEAIRWLARRATLRDRLATGGLKVAAARSWERSLRELSGDWQAVLSLDHRPAVRAA